jgi:hypothetical protein
MKAVVWAVGLVVVLNAVVIVPAARERAAPVHHVTVQVCGDHIQGGWRDGELPFLKLPLARRPGGWSDVIDAAALTSFGFTTADAALLGDTTASFGELPTPREAWLTMRQRDDSLHEYEILGAATTRPVGADGVLVLRGLVGFDWLDRPVPPGMDSLPTAAHRSQIGVSVMRLLPPQLGLDRAQAESLRPLLESTGMRCGRTIPVTLAFGSRGAVWVESVGSTP